MYPQVFSKGFEQEAVVLFKLQQSPVFLISDSDTSKEGKA